MLPRFLFTQEIQQTVDRWPRTFLGPGGDNRHKDGVQVFRARWFEAVFGTSHPATPGLWFLPLIGYCAHATWVDPRFSAATATGMFLGGLLFWTLLEYLLHRYLFHLMPADNFAEKFRSFMVHGYHHEFPNDRVRLVAPPVLSWPIALLMMLLHYLVAGPYHGLMTFAGTAAGYLAYDWVHYYTHHFRPTTRLGKFLRRYHMEHHYKDSTSHYGISSPLWDYVFGTVNPRPAARDETPDAA